MNDDTNNLNITRSKELQYDKEMQQSHFYMLLIARRDNNEHIFMSYCKGSNNNNIFDVVRSGRISSVCATTISQPLQDVRTQQSNIMYAVGCKDDSTKHY
jgi:hypothetical protein